MLRPLSGIIAMSMAAIVGLTLPADAVKTFGQTAVLPPFRLARLGR